MKISKKFYEQEAISLAENLLGKILVRKIGNTILKARIVETEAYPGENDKGSHNYGGRFTERTKTLYAKGGHIYIYLIYGMYELLNIVSGEEGSGQGVLIRAVEPLSELNLFSQNRFSKDYMNLSSYQKKNLTNGPGKLTKAMKITRKYNGFVLSRDDIYIEDDDYSNFEIVKTKRIGINYAEEAKDFPYRFYIKGNKYVSVKWFIVKKPYCFI